MGRKVSDEWVVPLSTAHHRAVHDVGNEERWWEHPGIDPVSEAQRLWQQTRGVEMVKTDGERPMKRRASQ